MASELILETLDDLGKDDFEMFKWYLSDNILDGCKPIPQAYLEEAKRRDTARKLTDSYGEELAVSFSIVILRKMYMNYEAEMLEEKYAAAGRKTAATSSSSTSSPSSSSTPSSSSASAPLAAPASISAVDGGVVIAPNVTGSTTGVLNITIHKP